MKTSKVKQTQLEPSQNVGKKEKSGRCEHFKVNELFHKCMQEYLRFIHRTLLKPSENFKI